METGISAAPTNGVNTATPTGTEVNTGVTGQPSGGANGQSATASESFIPQGIDLNTLPPQVRAYVEKVNNDMVRGFTEKTTKLSETAKALAAKELAPYQEKASAYERLLQEEEFVSKWNEYVEQKSRETQQQQNDPNGQSAKLLKEVQALKQSQEEIAFEVRKAEAAGLIDSFAAAKNEKGELLHPEFEKLANYSLGTNEKEGNFNLLRTAVLLAPGDTAEQKLENGYKAASEVYNAIYEEGRKAGLGRIQEKVRNGTTPPSSVSVTKFTEGRPKNALEALEWARKGISVQR